MTTLVVAAMLLPALAAFPLLEVAVGERPGRQILAAALAAGLSSGIAGAAYLAWLFLAPPAWIAPFSRYVDAALWVLVALIVFVRCRPRVHWDFASLSLPQWGLAAAPVIVMAVAAWAFHQHYLRIPHGEWDAWAIWNLKARFLARGGEHWRDVFSPLLTHASYPLLVPSAVARLWGWTGSQPPIAGGLVAAVFTFSIPAVVAGSLAGLRGWTTALWGAALVMAANPLTTYGAWQVADVPLAFFLLASVVLISLDLTDEINWRAAPWAGAAIGMTALVKNEGLVFSMAVTGAYIFARSLAGSLRFGDRTRRIALFLTVAAPFWLVLAAIRHAAPEAAMGAAFSDQRSLARVADLARHEQTLRAFVTTLWGWGGHRWAGALPFFGVALLAGGWRLERRLYGAAGFGAFAVAVMLFAYYAAYIVTPYDLEWHIRTSLHRILVHVWPVFVWTFCLVASFEYRRASSEVDSSASAASVG